MLRSSMPTRRYMVRLSILRRLVVQIQHPSWPDLEACQRIGRVSWVLSVRFIHQFSFDRTVVQGGGSSAARIALGVTPEPSGEAREHYAIGSNGVFVEISVCLRSELRHEYGLVCKQIDAEEGP